MAFLGEYLMEFPCLSIENVSFHLSTYLNKSLLLSDRRGSDNQGHAIRTICCNELQNLL